MSAANVVSLNDTGDVELQLLSDNVMLESYFSPLPSSAAAAAAAAASDILNSTAVPLLTNTWNSSWTVNTSDTWRNATHSTVMTSCFRDRLQLLRLICEVMISLPVAMVGIVGNLLSFVVLRRQRPTLTTTLILQALVITDIIILLIVIQLRCMPNLYRCGASGLRGYYFYYFEPTYHYLYPAVFVFRLIETWLTVLLTVERFIVVYRPLHAHHLCTAARIYRHVAVMCLTAAIFSAPRFVERFMTKENDFVQIYNVVYRILFFYFAMYLLPMAIMTTLNIRLLVALKRAALQRVMLAMHQMTDTRERPRDEDVGDKDEGGGRGGSDGGKEMKDEKEREARELLLEDNNAGLGVRLGQRPPAVMTADLPALIGDKQQTALPSVATHLHTAPLFPMLNRHGHVKAAECGCKELHMHLYDVDNGCDFRPDIENNDQHCTCDSRHKLLTTSVTCSCLKYGTAGIVRQHNCNCQQPNHHHHHLHHPHRHHRASILQHRQPGCRQQQRRHTQPQATLATVATVHQNQQTSSSTRLSSQFSQKMVHGNINCTNRSVTVTIVCLVATFMVCNSGAVVSHTLWSLANFPSLAWLEDYRRHIAHVSNVLTTVNSSANFVVCCLCSRLFRRTLATLLCRRHKNYRKQ